MIRQEKERLRHTQRPKVIDLAYSEHAALTLLTPDSARQVLCKRAAIGRKCLRGPCATDSSLMSTQNTWQSSWSLP